MAMGRVKSKVGKARSSRDQDKTGRDKKEIEARSKSDIRRGGSSARSRPSKSQVEVKVARQPGAARELLISCVRRSGRYGS